MGEGPSPVEILRAVKESVGLYDLKVDLIKKYPVWKMGYVGVSIFVLADWHGTKCPIGFMFYIKERFLKDRVALENIVKKESDKLKERLKELQ